MTTTTVTAARPVYGIFNERCSGHKDVFGKSNSWYSGFIIRRVLKYRSSLIPQYTNAVGMRFILYTVYRIQQAVYVQ